MKEEKAKIRRRLISFASDDCSGGLPSAKISGADPESDKGTNIKLNVDLVTLPFLRFWITKNWRHSVDIVKLLIFVYLRFYCNFSFGFTLINVPL